MRSHTTSRTPTNRLGRLLCVVSSAGFGTGTHALEGNVDILIALAMHRIAFLNIRCSRQRIDEQLIRPSE